MDYLLPEFLKCSKKYGNALEDARFARTMKALEFEKALFQGEVISGSRATLIIKFFMDIVEGELRKILHRHHPYYWKHLYRRLAPEDTFKNNNTWTVQLYRNILEAAICKYSNDKVDIFRDFVRTLNEAIQNADSNKYQPEFMTSNNQIINQQRLPSSLYLKKFTCDDLLELLSAEALAYEYWHLTVCYRRLEKGGKLHFDEDGDYTVINEITTENSIRIYDERVMKYEEACSLPGISIFNINNKTSKAWIRIPIYNVSRIKGVSLVDTPPWNNKMLDNELYSANFAWIPLDLEDYYKKHSFVEEKFFEKWNYAFWEFVTCFWVMAEFALMKSSEDIHHAYHLSQRAMIILTEAEFESVVTDVEEYINEIFESDSRPSFVKRKLSKKKIRMILNDHLLTDRMKKEISLETRGPMPFIIKLGNNGCLIDYLSLANIFVAKFYLLGETDVVKGHIFENYVNDLLATNGIETFWKAEHLDCFEREIEIDLAYILGEVMVLCELKCINMSLAYCRGDKNALQFRKMKYLKALNEIDKKAEILSKKPIGRNYGIPNNVKWIIPVAVGPFVEYLRLEDKNVWFDETTPRVITPAELKELLSNSSKLNRLIYCDNVFEIVKHDR